MQKYSTYNPIQDPTPKTLSVAQMREADRRCIEGLGMPGAVLMNQAGSAIFEVLKQLNPAGQPVGIVCGKGNNGGDGFVVARLALLAGWDMQLLLLADPAEIRGDAATFMQVYRRLGGEIHAATQARKALQYLEQMSTSHVLVDAMLGTGVTGAPRGIYRDVISAWPKVTTLSVDIPSGLNADSGIPEEPSIRADHTVTMQYLKQGFKNPAAAPHLGRVHIVDIGIPEICSDDKAWAALPDRK